MNNIKRELNELFKTDITTYEEFRENVKITFKGKHYKPNDIKPIYGNTKITDYEYNLKQFYIHLYDKSNRLKKLLYNNFKFKKSWASDMITAYNACKDDIYDEDTKTFNGNKGLNFKSFFKRLFFKQLYYKTLHKSKPTIKEHFNNFYKTLHIKTLELTDSSIQYLDNYNYNYTRKCMVGSVMNPLVIYAIFDKFFKDDKIIFNPCGSWLVPSYTASLFPNIKRFIAVDVIEEVRDRFYDLFEDNEKFDFYLQPSETLLQNNQFLTSYKECVDTVFFCPPYFDYEIYDGGSDNQSTTNYNTLDLWLEKYWDKTLQVNKHVLKKGGKMIYIIADSMTDGLMDKMELVANRYFTKVNVHRISLQSVSMSKTVSERFEYMYEFIK